MAQLARPAAGITTRTGSYEVLNFAVAAYSPLQRLETLRRKALSFQPDLVIYSATMLDLRLMEIHLCDALRTQADLTYDFVKGTFEKAGVGHELFEVDAEGKLIHKEEIKTRMRPYYWELYDQTLGALAGTCRSEGVPLVIVIIPRVGKADAPLARAESVARLKAIAGHHALPLYDLSDSFDRYDPASLEIAAWDDHPNALGHRRLFLALARSLVKDEARYHLLFPERPRAKEPLASRPPRSERQALITPGRKPPASRNERSGKGTLANLTPFPGSGNRAGLLRDVDHGWTPSEPVTRPGRRARGPIIRRCSTNTAVRSLLPSWRTVPIAWRRAGAVGRWAWRSCGPVAAQESSGRYGHPRYPPLRRRVCAR